MNTLSKRERRHFPAWDDPAECMFQKVTIDLESCDGCRLCTVVCPSNVLEMTGPKGSLKARVKDDHRGCISCNNCHAICANGAIGATRPYDFVGYYRQLGRGAFTPPRRF
jgi:2-oxoglutarate ferredoxin oxidoreductase subunit delta